MIQPIQRTRSVTTKVTEAEHAQLEHLAQARGYNLSEWVRQTLFAQSQGSVANEEVLLGELLGLRTIVINLMFSLAKGEAVTPETMESLIARADGSKVERAEKMLSAVQLKSLPSTNQVEVQHESVGA